MSKLRLVVSLLVYLAVVFVLPFLVRDSESILLAWMFVSIWYALYLFFKLRVEQKGMKQLWAGWKFWEVFGR